MGSTPSKRVPVKDDFQQEVIRAIKYSNVDDFKVMLGHNDLLSACHDNYPPNALNVAARCGQTEWLKYFIKKKLNVNNLGEGDETPLHLSVRTKRNGLECAKTLLNAKANINARNVWGRTPFMEAVVQFKFQMMDFLMAEGADINIPDYHKTTPLHVCSSYGKLDILKKMLAKGAHINAQDERGRTCLYFAILGNHSEMIDFLLANDADVNLYDPNFGSPLLKAVTMSDVKLVSTLLKVGASTSTCSCSKLSNIHLSLTEIALHTMQVSIEIVQSVEEDDENESIHMGPVAKALRHVQCFKSILIAHGYPVRKKIRDRIRHLAIQCKVPSLKSELLLLQRLADRMLLPPVVNCEIESLQVLARLQSRKYLMNSKKNVMWACDQLDVPVVLKDMLMFKL